MVHEGNSLSTKYTSFSDFVFIADSRKKKFDDLEMEFLVLTIIYTICASALETHVIYPRSLHDFAHINFSQVRKICLVKLMGSDFSVQLANHEADVFQNWLVVGFTLL